MHHGSHFRPEIKLAKSPLLADKAWNAKWRLSSRIPNSLAVIVDDMSDEHDDEGFMLGITPSDTNPYSEALATNSYYLKVNSQSTTLLCTSQTSTEDIKSKPVTLPGWSRVTDINGCKIQMEFGNGNLYFALNDHPRVLIKTRIQMDPVKYVPFLWIYAKQTQLIDTNNANTPNKMVKSLWTDKSFTDATIVCKDRTFNVHRSVLAVSSSFFAAAFRHDMKEGKAAEITMQDIEGNVLEVCDPPHGSASASLSWCHREAH